MWPQDGSGPRLAGLDWSLTPDSQVDGSAAVRSHGFTPDRSSAQGQPPWNGSVLPCTQERHGATRRLLPIWHEGCLTSASHFRFVNIGARIKMRGCVAYWSALSWRFHTVTESHCETRQPYSFDADFWIDLFLNMFLFELKLRQSVFVNKGPIDFTIMKEPLRRPWESSRLYATYASVCF